MRTSPSTGSSGFSRCPKSNPPKSSVTCWTSPHRLGVELTEEPLADSTNLGLLIESCPEHCQIELLVDNKYLYELRIPREFRSKSQENPQVRQFNAKFENFGLHDKSSVFISNYADVVEKVSQLNQSGITHCSAHKLGSFLLSENQRVALQTVAPEQKVSNSDELVEPAGNTFLFRNMSLLEKNKYYNLNFHLSLQKLSLESKLKELQKEKSGIMEKVDKNIRRVKLAFLGMTMLQFGFFYHCIFNVEWLGWDIMEPITYSLEIAKFLFFLRFFYMNQKDGGLDGIYDVMVDKYCQRFPTVGNQLNFVQQRIEETEKKLAVIYDYDFIYN